ncbi:MAG: HlyD family type I secretion periplasmic adaptor subunit [Rhodocyclales bacterium]|nr:HlyD family type I secretion periplasmic adaptor subunit [Rhodocyclales bacterium]
MNGPSTQTIDGAPFEAPVAASPEEIEVRKWGKRGLVAALLGCGLPFIWAVVAPLDSAVVASGVLKVSSYRQVVQHQEGGIVKAILVRNGDQVKRGQPLLTIEDLRVTATVDSLEQQYYSEWAKNIRLQAERGMNPALGWPDELRARQAVAAIGEVLAKEHELFEQRKRTLEAQIGILNRQAQDAGEEITATGRQVEADRASLKAAQNEVRANRTLLDKGFVSPARMMALERAEADYASRQAEHEADLARARQKQSDLRFRLEGLRTSYRDGAASELRDSTDRLNDIRQKVKPMVDARERQQVVAPTDGLVVDLKVHTIGATIGPREVLMEVVPQGQKLVAELNLPVDSIGDLKIGMPAEVRLKAFQQRTTPLVTGKLEYVSADALTDPRAPQQPYYLARVGVDEAALKAANIGVLQAGMPVEVYLRSRSRSAMAYLLDPVTQSLDRAFRER